MPEKTAILLINWNSYTTTADCLVSLAEIKAPLYDIIVVDNASSDKSGERLKQDFPHIILLSSETNTGFAEGNNIGLRYAIAERYKYVWVLNNDTFTETDTLTVLTSFMDEHPSAGAIQPAIFWNHNRTLLWNGRCMYNPWLGFTYSETRKMTTETQREGAAEADWLTGCSFFIRTSVLQETGLFTPELFMYYEDVDLSFRIRACGYKLYYHPGASIYHIAGASATLAAKKGKKTVSTFIHYLSIRNKIWLLKKYTKPLHWPTVFLYNTFYMVAMLGYFTLRFNFRKFSTVIHAVADGITGRWGFDPAKEIRSHRST